MTVFLWILFSLAVGLLLVVTSIQPKRFTFSAFERDRRAKLGHEQALKEQTRALHLADITTVLRIVSTLLLVVVILLSVHLLGWGMGILVAVIVSLEYVTVARLPIVVRGGELLYEKVEPYLTVFVTRADWLLRIFRGRITPVEQPVITSREEFEHVVGASQAGFSADEKKLLVHAATFGSRKVSEVMTPRSVVDTVKSSELLGPVMLDELHTLGHSRLPVVDGDIDHVVGILYVQDLLTVHQKKSLTAAQAMEPKVFYIHEEQSLQHALNAFIRTQHHLFVVVNEYRETVGVLSLEDVVEALLGRKIVDEFDAHDDLRAVAARNPRGNNDAKVGTDV